MTHTRIRNKQKEMKKVARFRWLLRCKQTLTVGVAGLLLCAVTLSGLWSLNQSLSIQQWNIYAAAPLKADIEQALQKMESLDFWHSRPAYLRQQLLSRIPDLADIHIQRQLPNTLIIHVTSRKAIALWFNKEAFNKGILAKNQGSSGNTARQGQLYLVDESGIAYRPRKYGESSDLPVLRMKLAYLQAACQWLATLKRDQPQWFARSSELFATHDGWKLNLTAGQQWHLPFGLRGLQNINLLTNILKQPRWQAGHWCIDTRLENRWFLRPATHEGIV
ncbi:MAG: FtsQ-type POTRA domain-containing protein [Mariprofundaceae bacterium]|nr:FtsQ-type POTRA domain-containing protein [Mariprofundaceae bacterium]